VPIQGTCVAAFSRPQQQELRLSGDWTAQGISAIAGQLDDLPANSDVKIVSAAIARLDSAGAWVLAGLCRRLRAGGAKVELRNLPPDCASLLEMAEGQMARQAEQPAAEPHAQVPKLEMLGRRGAAVVEQGISLLAFVGESAITLANCLAHPARFRWRPVLYNIRSAGLDALPIVGLLSFLLGVVVAYQGAGQLRQYGANIFVADLVGLSMLREFAPLMTAIIVAGRSGSAYAAQIGTMSVSEEIDAMLTLGISPQELLVLPKLFALMIALPLLTVFADALGVFGGMLMAQVQLGVSVDEFAERFVKAVSLTSYLTGIGKAPVFAAIIVIIGCFQGFRTTGGADSVGRHTTRSVVQSIFLVVVADAVFSVAFSLLDL
jgi:phospholipid/cholesterol/gamma-HCH transport system permease protein